MSTINPEQLKTVLGAYYRANTDQFSALINSPDNELQPHLNKITRVKGRVPVITSVISRVIQSFSTEWNELGETYFLAREMENHRAKINFPIKPDEIEGSYLAFANDNTKPLKDRLIGTFIVEKLLKPIIDLHMEELMIYGDRTSVDPFMNAFNGLVVIKNRLLADTTRPCYRIPLTTFTAANVNDELLKFELALPSKIQKRISKIFVSKTVKNWAYLDALNSSTNATLPMLVNSIGRDGNNYGSVNVTTTFGRKLIGLDMPDDMVFATVDGNLCHIIDMYDKPELTDMQPQDYKLKLFFNAWQGIDFNIPEMTFIANFADAKKGYPAALFTGAGAIPEYFRDQATWS